MIFDKIFKNSEGEYINLIDVLFGSNELENYIYTLAEAHAIDMIATTIAKCEIQTFEKNSNKEICNNKGDLYWTLNIQPNFNENGTRFLYKLVTKLLTDKTALVLINKTPKTNLLYVAESYDEDKQILKAKSFKNVTVLDDEGNEFKLNKTYNSENSIYISLRNTKLISASESFKANTTKILKAVQKEYIRAHTSKWRLKNPGTQPKLFDAETQKEMDYSSFKEKITEGAFKEEDAIVMLSEAFDLINLNRDNNKNFEELEKIFKRISNSVAQNWKIPLDIFYGNKTEKSTGNDDFITFAVDVYFELLEDSFNIGLVGKDDYLNGEYVQFNRLSINHRDLIDKSSGLDKLLSSGFSFNQLLELLGLPVINEDWANEHYITKNYANVKGGAEENG